VLAAVAGEMAVVAIDHREAGAHVKEVERGRPRAELYVVRFRVSVTPALKQMERPPATAVAVLCAAVTSAPSPFRLAPTPLGLPGTAVVLWAPVGGQAKTKGR
jgi:hypothetical protein